MTLKFEDPQYLQAERDRLLKLVRDIAHGHDRGAVSHGDIADMQKEIDRIDAILARTND